MTDCVADADGTTDTKKTDCDCKTVGWSTTKKILVWGGVGLGVLIVFLLIVFFIARSGKKSQLVGAPSLVGVNFKRGDGGLHENASTYISDLEPSDG